MLTVGSYFTGIGGLDRGLEQAGMRVIYQCETDPYCCAVLEKNWPGIPNLGDIRKVTTAPYADVLCGGFPCQPVSLAGKRRGSGDDRWLWPEFARLIRILRPRYALMENVPGLLSRGLGQVLGDLAELGYDAEWNCIPAAALGAPHRRYRVFIVAYPDRRGRQGVGSGRVLDGERPAFGDDPDGCGSQVADAKGDRWEPRWPGDAAQESRGWEPDRGGSGTPLADSDREGSQGWDERQWSARQLFVRPSGWPDSGYWRVEPDVGRVAHGVPSRVDRLRALGNAVVPQVAEWAGKQIVKHATMAYHTAAGEAATRS